MKKPYYKSDFLFARSSFFIGLGSIMAIFSPYYTFNESQSDAEADRKAIESDFGTIGEDIKNVLKSFKI